MMARRLTAKRRVIAVALGCALAALMAGVASAHALPMNISPADGAVLKTRPTEVSADTGEKMTTKAGDNDLIVNDSSGKQVTTQHATVDANQTHISVPLPADLTVGIYTVRWFTVSADDGESASGSWKFTFDPSKAAASGTQKKFEPPPNRTPLYIGIAAAVVIIMVAAGAFAAPRRRRA